MRFSTRLCCLVGTLALLMPLLILQRTSANRTSLTIERAPSLVVPVQAPEDIAGTVAFLARSEFITGQVFVVDGGRTLT